MALCDVFSILDEPKIEMKEDDDSKNKEEEEEEFVEADDDEAYWLRIMSAWMDTHKLYWMRQYVTGRSQDIVICGHRSSQTHFDGLYHGYRSG